MSLSSSQGIPSDVLSSFGLRFIRAEKLTQAVVHVDFSYIDCTVGSQEGMARFF